MKRCYPLTLALGLSLSLALVSCQAPGGLPTSASPASVSGERAPSAALPEDAAAANPAPAFVTVPSSLTGANLLKAMRVRLRRGRAA